MRGSSYNTMFQQEIQSFDLKCVRMSINSNNNVNDITVKRVICLVFFILRFAWLWVSGLSNSK